MKKEKVLETAKIISNISENSINEFNQKMDLLLYEANQKMIQRPDINDLIGGEKNFELMKDNHSNHIKFIYSYLAVPDSELLIDTVCWVFRVYMTRGFTEHYWIAQLNTWLSVFQKNLSENCYNEIKTLYNWMIINIPFFSSEAMKVIKNLL